MTTLFGQGKPSGALGGVSYAETERRTNRDSDLAHQTKKAEFMDYLMDAELRQTARDLGTAVNKSKQRMIPSAEKADIAENQAREAAAQTALAVEPDKRRQQLQQIHTAMTDQQYNDVSRAYLAFQDGIRAGAPANKIYDQTRAEIIRASRDKVAANEWLTAQGIGQEYSPEGVNALAGLAHYGVTDSATARSAYLTEREWQFKLEQERIKAAAAGKPTDRSFKPPTPDQIKATGDILAKDVKYFDDLEGGMDDKGNYTGSKGALVTTVAKWANRANADLIVGDTKAFPTDYEMVASDILNFSRQQVSSGGGLWGWISGGKDFNPGAFYVTATEAMNMLEVERRVLAASGKDIPVASLWKLKGPQIMQQMRDSDAQSELPGNQTKRRTEDEPPITQPQQPKEKRKTAEDYKKELRRPGAPGAPVQSPRQAMGESIAPTGKGRGAY